MTVHFVTTGMSLRTHSRCWRDADGYAVQDLDGIRTEELSPDERGTLEAIRADVFEQLSGDDGSNARDIVGRRFRSELWSYSRGHLMSAELNTIVKMATPVSNRPELIRAGDEIHLLAGTSNRHECALLWAILGHVAPLHLPRVTVTMSEPRTIDPTSRSGFHAGMSAVWEHMSARDRRGAGPGQGGVDLSLVLTGGYKAVLIYLATLIGYEQRTASLHYLYEDRDSEVITITITGGRPTSLDYVFNA